MEAQKLERIHKCSPMFEGEILFGEYQGRTLSVERAGRVERVSTP